MDFMYVIRYVGVSCPQGKSNSSSSCTTFVLLVDAQVAASLSQASFPDDSKWALLTLGPSNPCCNSFAGECHQPTFPTNHREQGYLQAVRQSQRFLLLSSRIFVRVGITVVVRGDKLDLSELQVVGGELLSVSSLLCRVENAVKSLVWVTRCLGARF